MQRCTTERLLNARRTAARRPFPPSRIARIPWEMSRPRPRSDRRNAVRTFSFSVSVSTNPRKRFSPLSVIPSAMTIVASANVFPSRKIATMSSLERSRSLNSRKRAALASTNDRDTVELDSPMAPGIDSAAFS
jgi:hypothetical protein